MNNLDLEAVDERADSTNDLIDKAVKYGKGGSTLRLSSNANDAQLQWRRVEDELPERNEVVLVCFKSGYNNSLIRTMAYRTFDPGRCCWSTDLVYEEPDGYAVDDMEVTHWMPLPDLPL
jgi:hypothetical protein